MNTNDKIKYQKLFQDLTLLFRDIEGKSQLKSKYISNDAFYFNSNDGGLSISVSYTGVVSGQFELQSMVSSFVRGQDHVNGRHTTTDLDHILNLCQQMRLIYMKNVNK